MNSSQNYPDYSQPVNAAPAASAASAYPDYSKPQENSEAVHPKHHDDILSSMWNKYQDIITPKPGEGKGPTAADQIVKGLTSPMQKDTLKTAAGFGTMLLAPELKVGSMIPGGLRAMMPEITGAAKLAKDYMSTVGKTGAAGYLGTKMLPHSTEDQAQESAALGTGISAITTPMIMALASSNPYVRYLMGGGLGAITGYGASQLTGHPAASTGVGATLGALLG